MASMRSDAVDCAMAAAGAIVAAKATPAAMLNRPLRRRPAIAIARVTGKIAIAPRPQPRSETESGGEQGAVHVHSEFGARGAEGEVQAAKSGVQVDPGFERVIDGGQHLPIDMGAESEAAKIPVSRRTEPVSEIPVIAQGQKRIGPG